MQESHWFFGKIDMSVKSPAAGRQYSGEVDVRGTQRKGEGKLNYVDTGNGVLLRDVEHFEPEHIFECGQCFRWNRQEDGSYLGVAMGRVLRVRRTGEGILFEGTNMEDFQEIWIKYFDMKRDYGRIKEVLSRDPVLEKAVKFGYGMRILRQDVWETLISFIISANNNIPRIKRTIEKLCRCFGEKVEYNGEIYYLFPSPEKLVHAKEEDILNCGCGYRARYIASAARVVARGEMDIYAIENLDTHAGRQNLLRLQGVGPKIADCILLFSMGKYDAFPVDVWVKRVMEYFYLGKDTSLKAVQGFASRRFGRLAGFAQQYLFYYARGLLGNSIK